MKRHPIILLALCVSVALISAAPAQDAGQDQGKKPSNTRGRAAWFIYTDWPDGVENPVTVLSGKTLIEVTLSKRAASQPVKVPETGLLGIVREVGDPANSTQPVYEALAKIVVPQSVSKALVILSPAAKSEKGLIFDAQVLDLAVFTGGDYLFLNLTPVNIGVQMGEEKMRIQPDAYKIYDAPRLSSPTNAPIRYFYEDPDRNKWRLLSASTVVLRPTRREICVFSWNPRSKRVGYHGITFPVAR